MVYQWSLVFCALSCLFSKIEISWKAIKRSNSKKKNSQPGSVVKVKENVWFFKTQVDVLVRLANAQGCKLLLISDKADSELSFAVLRLQACYVCETFLLHLLQLTRIA